MTSDAINTALTLLGQCVPGPLHHQTLEILCGFNDGKDDFVYSSQDSESQLNVIEDSEPGTKSSGLTGNAFYLVAYGIPGFVLLVVVVIGMTVVVRRKCVRVDSPVIEQQIV